MGSGYTDHCPKCLWSLHVDNNPGDRVSKCKGKMRPERAVYDNGYTLSYLCLKCGAKKEIRAAANDNEELLLLLVKSLG